MREELFLFSVLTQCPTLELCWYVVHSGLVTLVSFGLKINFAAFACMLCKNGKCVPWPHLATQLGPIHTLPTM